MFLEWWYPDISTAFAMKVADVFLQVLSNILTKPDSVVGELDFLSERDRKQVSEWNATLPETVDRCVHEVIQDQARIRPDAEAVCAWDGSFTYYELDQLASKLACHLVELGVSQDNRVALCFEKSVSVVVTCFKMYSIIRLISWEKKWNIVAMLGVLKAGGAFVPLDASHPRPRLQALVRAIDAAVFLCSQQQAALFATVAERVLPLDGSMIECLPTSLIVADSPRRATGKSAAYLIFTSGSTGEPKVSQRNGL
jgi:non-ribosomal peptide synthetase component F